MEDPHPARGNKVAQYQAKALILLQRFEDMAVPFRVPRWAGFFAFLGLYFLRIYFLGGYYIVTYGLCIHLVYLLALMVTPIAEPEQPDADGPSLGSTSDGEFKPFIPKLQEFKVWRNMMRAVFIAFSMTLFSIFDIPAYWPILVIYFLVLFVSQFWSRVEHMLKHKYVPWQRNKPKYVPKDDK